MSYRRLRVEYPCRARVRRAKLKRKLLSLGMNFKAINSKKGTITVPESKLEEVLQLIAFVGAEKDYVVLAYGDSESLHD